MKNYKQRLAELNNSCTNKKRKSTSELILLFIAQATAETNSNVKWLIWIAGIGITVGLGFLIALAVRGF